MIVLGIETAGDKGSVALVEPDALGGPRVTQVVIESSRQLGAELAPTIQRLLRAAGLGPSRTPDLVAVDTGPGSYTGLRIGLAAAKALCWRFGLPLVGVDHVQAHVHTGLLADPAMPLPCLALVASGGHTAMYLLHEPARSERLGTTPGGVVIP